MLPSSQLRSSVWLDVQEHMGCIMSLQDSWLDITGPSGLVRCCCLHAKCFWHETVLFVFGVYWLMFAPVLDMAGATDLPLPHALVGICQPCESWTISQRTPKITIVPMAPCL